MTTSEDHTTDVSRRDRMTDDRDLTERLADDRDRTDDRDLTTDRDPADDRDFSTDRDPADDRGLTNEPDAGVDSGSAPTDSVDATSSAPASPTTDTATEDDEERPPMVSRDSAEGYATRWNEIKGMFVDEPRQAVRQADGLVGELLDDIEQLFRAQRQELEQGLDSDDTSTEDLRVALRRYRSFFDRLLSV